MNKPNGKRERRAVLFFLGILLFNYPILALFDHPGTLFGMPVLFAYVFAAWGAYIVLAARLIDKA